MIPILEHRLVTQVLADKNLSLPLLCSVCSKRIELDPTRWCAVHWTELAHWNWPSAPWMYLKMADSYRAGFHMSEYLLGEQQVWVWWEDTKTPCCLPCFLSFIEQYENACEGTDYWPIVLAIRKRYAAANTSLDFQSDGSADQVVDTPPLLPSQGRGDGGDA